jgi:hypothetical protein
MSKELCRLVNQTCEALQGMLKHFLAKDLP